MASMYGSSDDSAALMRQEEQAKNRRIGEGKGLIEQQFATFTPEFYNKRAADYQAYALPTLSREYASNRKQLTYKLADQGLLQSGAGAESASSLMSALRQGQRSVANEGVSQAQQLRSTVEQGRQTAMSQLLASADPYAAAQSAYGTASQASAPSVFAPVGNLLNNWRDIYLANNLSSIWGPLSQQSAQQQGRDLSKTFKPVK